MAISGKLLRLLGVVIGATLLILGILGAVFLSKPKPQEMARVPVRPVKTMLVGGPVPTTLRRYPGKVQAAERVVLSFDVAGAIEFLPVVSGQRVAKGEILARLDPRDYQNALNARKALENERSINADRVRAALEKGAATGKELDQAMASFDVAKAEAAIAEKALDDSVIRAPFDGVVAYLLVRQYQKVAAKEPVMSLQAPSELEVVIQLPEQIAALARPQEEGRTLTASFDFLPGREFPMTVKEYATEADPATQTYRITLAMPAPTDVTILPGMSATVSVTTTPVLSEASQGYLLPLTAVPASGQGEFNVWIVQPAQDGLHTVRRQKVSVGPMVEDSIFVTDGVAADQRVVTAGAHFLEDGQVVRLLESRAEGERR